MDDVQTLPASVPVVSRAPTAPANILSQYVCTAPHPQNAVDIFQGEWSSALPTHVEPLRAGNIALFEDIRVAWAAQQLGGFRNRRVLELGPLEGGHTYQIERGGASSVTAVEANTRAYLKCLIVKEVLGLRRSNFLCGDLTEYLKTDTGRFDVCFASGVLYHLQHPVEVLARLAQRTDRLFLWTHYFDEEPISTDTGLAERFTDYTAAEYGGFKHQLHRYEYRHALAWNGFCGGTADFSCWLDRETILAALEWFGFDDIRIGFEEPTFPHGPCFAVAAIRRSRWRRAVDGVKRVLGRRTGW